MPCAQGSQLELCLAIPNRAVMQVTDGCESHQAV